MDDTKLIDLGAECVCGDLILDRKTVGRYRGSQFLLTPEGEEALEQARGARSAAQESDSAKAAPRKGRKNQKADEPEHPAGGEDPGDHDSPPET